MEKADVHTWASRLIVLVLSGGLFFIIGKYGVPVLMPFLLASGLVMLVYPLGKKLSRLTSLSSRLCCVGVLMLLLSLLGGALYLGGYYLWREASALYAWLYENADYVADALSGLLDVQGEGSALPAFVQRILALPLIADFFGGLDTLVQELMGALLTRFGEAVTGAALHAATAFPSGVLSVLVFLLSCFYMAWDGDRLLQRLFGWFAPASGQRIRQSLCATADALRAYLRAYGLLFCLTLAMLLIGFWLIGIRYAFLIALLIALLDLLPALGAVVVLLPWSAVAFASGDLRTGVGLLILGCVVTVFRQIAEPKIVGKSLGLHPLAALVSMYVGLRLFGAAGLVLGPCAAIVLRTVVRGANEQ